MEPETGSGSAAGQPQPPSPGLSRSTALRLIRKDPIALLERAARAGDVVALPLPRFRVVLLNRPELVWDVLATNNHGFMKGPTMQVAKRLLGESLLTSEGDVHARQRRLIQPVFHHQRIDAYADDMAALGERAADRWHAGETLDIHQEMARVTLAIVGRTLFDTDVEAEESHEISAALTEVLAQFNRAFSPFLPITQRLPLPSTRRFQHSRQVFDRTIYGMIADRRTRGTTDGDLLSLLLQAHEAGAGMTDTQVRDEAITLFLAGHETTANALTWAWYLLSQHPEAEAALHAELAEVLGGRVPTVNDVPRLSTTAAVLSESLRLYPPAWAMGRRALVDHRADGFAIPAGSVIVVSPYLLHHDERWWPEPTTFSAGSLDRRGDRRTASPCLHPLRRRTPHVHR